MLQFEELMQKLRNQQPELKDLADALGIERMKNEIAELDMRAAEPVEKPFLSHSSETYPFAPERGLFRTVFSILP